MDNLVEKAVDSLLSEFPYYQTQPQQQQIQPQQTQTQQAQPQPVQQTQAGSTDIIWHVSYQGKWYGPYNVSGVSSFAVRIGLNGNASVARLGDKQSMLASQIPGIVF